MQILLVIWNEWQMVNDKESDYNIKKTKQNKQMQQNMSDLVFWQTNQYIHLWAQEKNSNHKASIMKL